MSLRDRLAAKARRRTSFPVEISDAGEARRRVEAARQKTLLGAAFAKNTPEQQQKLQDELDAAEATLAGHYEHIEFQAAHPADYEALSAAHFKGKDEDEIDVDDVLPPLAAICAVDEDLRDEGWWREQLDPATGTWSVGERRELYSTLLNLNLATPDARIPKG